MVRIFDGGIHIKHNRNFIMKRKKGVPEFLLLFIKTEAKFILDGKKRDVPHQSILLIDRKTSYEYGNPSGDYIDTWLHFDIDEPKLYKELHPILNNIFYCQNLPQLELYLQQLLWEKEYAHPKFKQENINFLFKTLINNIITVYEQRNNNILNSPYYLSFQNLRLTIQSDPKATLSAKKIAHSLDISISHFHHLYKSFFQSTFRNELIYFRIEKAKKLLTTTDFSVNEIMETCGYQNTVHFYRQFKQHVNMTPSEFRVFTNYH